MTRAAQVALLWLGLASCAPRSAPVDAASAPEPARHDLVVTPRGGEVWAWDVAVTARAEGATLTRCWETTRGRGEGGTTLRVPLDAGPQDVRIACRDTQGVEHRAEAARFDRRLPDGPEPRVVVGEATRGLALDGSASVPHGATLAAFAWSGVASSDGARARVDGPGVVRLRVEDRAGRAAETALRIVQEGERLVARDGAERRATDADLSVVYGVHPPLYGRPGLPAVTRKLAELAELGVTVVWISPPYASPDGDYGYAVTDPFRLREEAGSEADLRALVDEAHRLGLRVVLDFVPNHTSDRHPWFVAATEAGASTHAFRFHERDGEGTATHYFDWKNLPNLDYGSRDVQNATKRAASHWQRTGVDGFRVDAAWGVLRRAPSYVPEWVRAVRAGDPDALLFAEASARDPAWLAAGFDAAYDWTDELGKWAWEDVFDGDARTIPDRLDAALTTSRARTPGPAQRRVLRFLDNNDTGARFVTRHGAVRTRAATAALLTLPGTPVLFAGSEVGAEYEPYAGAAAHGVLAAPEDRHALRPYVRDLVALRRAHPALRSEHLDRLTARDARTGALRPDVYPFARRDEATGERLVVAIRFGAAPSGSRDVRVSGGGRPSVVVPDLDTYGIVVTDRARGSKPSAP